MFIQRRKEKQQRELMQEEKSSLKDKVTRVEELMKAKDELVEKLKQECESYRQEHLRRREGEEALTNIVMEHRKVVAQQRGTALQEFQRLSDKAVKDKETNSKQTVQQLQDAQHQNKRLEEKILTLETKLQHQTVGTFLRVRECFVCACMHCLCVRALCERECIVCA
jgi:hypothetical protein